MTYLTLKFSFKSNPCAHLKLTSLGWLKKKKKNRTDLRTFGNFIIVNDVILIISPGYSTVKWH